MNEFKKFGLALSVVVLGTVVLFCMWKMKDWTRPLTEFEKEERAHVKLVNSWLKDQRNGGDGFYYWTENSRPYATRFYSVESWEVLKSSLSTSTLLVNSSTKGGIPIRKTWEVWTRQDDNGKPGIYRLEDLSL